ncbi:MAG: tRNA (N(6)-L-threonylcarbamoyladenosine(37)-C(2))-methylthiotransferase MtaB [Bacillota bacterium]
MKVAFETLGCKVNHYESEALKSLFENRGYTLGDFNDFADVYVINTCTVTNQSDAKSRKMIRKAVKRNPEAVVAVIGCYAQLESETVAQIDGVDIIMGTVNRPRLLEYVEKVLRERKPIMDITETQGLKAFDSLKLDHFEKNTRAFLKIQDGCNQYCSYCIIPFARGPIRSKPPEEVLSEARDLVHKGYKEIVLSGIHTGGYGTDLEDTSFYDLLKAMSEIEGLRRLRISSVEINQLTDPILDLMESREVFARQLHIPLQHGDDQVLAHMRRRYTVAEYLRKIDAIRARMPEIAITTDLIVGYPTEDEAAFATMLETVKKAAFSELHVFPYSRRGGTKAAKMKHQVHGAIKSRRVNDLIALGEQLALDYRNRLKADGKTLDVLFESCDQESCEGHSSEYIRIEVPSTRNLENTLQKVTIDRADYPVSKGHLSDKK